MSTPEDQRDETNGNQGGCEEWRGDEATEPICRLIQHTVLGLTTGGDGPGRVETDVEAHLSTCADCRSVLRTDRDLVAFAGNAEAPASTVDAGHSLSPFELGTMRQRVMQRIDPDRHRPTLRAALTRTAARFGTAAAVPALPWAAVTLLACGLALAAGWALGSGNPRSASGVSEELPVAGLDAASLPVPGFGGDPFHATETAAVVAAMDALSQGSRPFESRRGYELSNVQFERVGGERIALSFDWTAHVEVVRPLDDPLVTEVLVQALDPSNTLPDKLLAVEETRSVPDRRVVRALVRSALDDDSEVVRQLALERLVSARLEGQPVAEEEIVDEALLEILRNEPSVPMRLLALDGLTAPGVLLAPHERERFESALADSPEPGVEALLVRAADRLERAPGI
ncbi:MAG: hypothetical protein DWQ36_06755 [Acidobacteria bacterium]|nr:MAG: hypothetical protein DWQ30_24190 [Acidobacteriota bacterium]REK09249.1 MAG: hypothetical protein DWQ36_06755 [Acidobacteriota bacterium]